MTSAHCTEFYPAVGLRVWVAGHAVADAGQGAGQDAGAAWIPAAVVGAPVDVVGQWAVRFGAADAQRTERVAWTALAPRSIDGTRTSPTPSLPPRTLSTNAAPLCSGRADSAATGAASLNQSELSATRAAYRRDQFEQNAARHWDLFYRSNTVNFFKDRHWLDREFPEIGGRPTAAIPTHRNPYLSATAASTSSLRPVSIVDRPAQIRWWLQKLRLDSHLC